jgi:hypothetical protein
MKLKTLKNITVKMQDLTVGKVNEIKFEDGPEATLLKMELRQEAINWIKEWKRDSIEAMRTEHYPQAMISDAKIEAFMNFFNITDEELK